MLLAGQRFVPDCRAGWNWDRLSRLGGRGLAAAGGRLGIGIVGICEVRGDGRVWVVSGRSIRGEVEAATVVVMGIEFVGGDAVSVAPLTPALSP